jgi:hypothetical protein
MSILPQQATVGPRHLRVRHLRVEHAAELAGLCETPPTMLLTWLHGPPTGRFAAAVTTERAGERLTLQARDVVRAIVPPSVGVVRAGQELFGWLYRHRLTVDGPTVEEHLIDADGAHAIALEVAVAHEAPPGHARGRTFRSA